MKTSTHQPTTGALRFLRVIPILLVLAPSSVHAQKTDTFADCTITRITSYNTPIPCQEERALSSDLDHAVQRIPSIFIAVPNEDGSRKEDTAVEMSATATTLKIHGSLVTNNNQRNKATTSGDRKNFSIL